MDDRNTIAIIGGGISGALTAFQLVRRNVPARVVLIDPSPEPGLGLAYSTTSFQHLLNVPAGKISALPSQPSHFLHWLQANYDPQATEDDFAPRAIYGRYIRSIVTETPEIEHLQTTVVDCRIEGRQAILTMADGGTLTASTVVLTTGNFNPAQLPGVSAEAIASGAYRNSAWEHTTFESLPTDAPIALVGAGLTAVDVLLRLREQGHCGTVTAISRYAVLPHRHAAYEPLLQCIISGKPPATVRKMYRIVRQAIQSGTPWRAVIDSLRPRVNELWLSLSIEEKNRFRRHLQRRWDVVRHRMAPPIADRLATEIATRAFVHRQGALHAVLPAKDGVTVQFCTRDGKIAEVSAARVINCTGPDTNYRRVGSPLLNSLFAQGQIVEGPLGRALWTDHNGALRAQDGATSPILFNVGPGRLGTLFESIAVPELRGQAEQLAELLATRYAEDRTLQRLKGVA
jgi:uncharacterized NAD(P)/FAD-binding protein YdhS